MRSTGAHTPCRRWLEERKQPYVLQVPKTNTVWYDGRRQTAAQLAEQLPADAWTLRSVGLGVQGERCALWACLPLSEACPDGMRRWLLIQQDVADASDRASHLAYGPTATPEAELLRVCGSRWPIEAGFAHAKGEVGLDQDEVRSWTAWHRFVTLCLLAQAYLVITRLAANAEEQAAAKGGPRSICFPSSWPRCAGWSWRSSRVRSGAPGVSAGRCGGGRSRRWRCGAIAPVGPVAASGRPPA